MHKYLYRFCVVILCAFLFCYSNDSYSQVNPQNLSTVRVDELSDDQIRQFMAQVEAAGIPDSQLEQVALARGMRPEEIQKLRIRIDGLKKAGTKDQKDTKLNNEPNGSRSSTGRTTAGLGKQDSLAVKQDSVSDAERALNGLR